MIPLIINDDGEAAQAREARRAAADIWQNEQIAKLARAMAAALARPVQTKEREHGQ